MEKRLPLYKIQVNPNDESGVYAVSLVDEPAIEENWIKLSKQVQIKFSADKDKRMLYGPMLIPGKMIYRRDESGYEYNIMFDKDTIELIAEKFNKNKLGDQFNFQHSDQMVEAFLKENWLTEDPDKSKKYGFELPEGTWFGAVKVEDEKFWDTYVKGEEVKGFSVEILAGAELVEFNSHVNNNNNNSKTQFMEIKRKDGVSIYTEAETVEVGTPLFLDETYTEKAPEGEHELEDGTIVIVDAEGVVSELRPVQEEEEVEEVQEEMEEVKTELEEEEVEEKPEEEEKEPSFEEKVISVIQPLLDKLTEQSIEVMNKVTELESKLTQKEEEVTEMNELKSQVEKLSSMAGAETITKKSDEKKNKIEGDINEKINIFRKFR